MDGQVGGGCGDSEEQEVEPPPLFGSELRGFCFIALSHSGLGTAGPEVARPRDGMCTPRRGGRWASGGSGRRGWPVTGPGGAGRRAIPAEGRASPSKAAGAGGVHKAQGRNPDSWLTASVQLWNQGRSSQPWNQGVNGGIWLRLLFKTRGVPGEQKKRGRKNHPENGPRKKFPAFGRTRGGRVVRP